VIAPGTERRLLQAAILLACIVPLAAGLDGIRRGAGVAADPGFDSHVRYLSGLLFGIGIAFAALTPRVETAGPVFRVLAAIVFVGGLARLWAAFAVGWPDAVMAGALVMELAVTPALALWQWRVARRVTSP
jgi:hypothetical protein